MPARILTVANQKGGVGKTTTAVSLGAELAGRYRVLLIDLDPQANATSSLGRTDPDREQSTYDVLLGTAALADVIVQTDITNLDLAPADRVLAGAQIELVDFPDRERRLDGPIRALTGAPDGPPAYDLILIDTPPSLGLLTLNALTAADTLLVPLQCEFFALEGLSQLLQTVERVQQRFNADLGIIGVVLTMFDRRNRLTDQVADDVRDCLGGLVFESVIPRNVRLSEAPSHGLPALIYDHACAGSRAYMALARELISRLPEERKAA